LWRSKANIPITVSTIITARKYTNHSTVLYTFGIIIYYVKSYSKYKTKNNKLKKLFNRAMFKRI